MPTVCQRWRISYDVTWHEMSVIVRSWGCRYWDCEMVTFTDCIRTCWCAIKKLLTHSDCFHPYVQPQFRMNGHHVDSYMSVSVPNGFHATVPVGSSVGSYENLIDLSPPRCRVSSNADHQDSVPDSKIARVAYDSPSLPTNGVLYRTSSESSGMSHLPLHYWSGEHWTYDVEPSND